jgi:hypothetical protein
VDLWSFFGLAAVLANYSIAGSPGGCLRLEGKWAERGCCAEGHKGTGKGMIGGVVREQPEEKEIEGKVGWTL